jgi:hypothetical protein
VKQGLPVAYLLAVAGFCSLPYLAPPSLAIPEAEYAALACLSASAIAFAALRRSTFRLGFLPVYLLGCSATLLSSVSWFGVPFIDAVFMLTAFFSAVTLLILAVVIVVRFLRARPARTKANAETGA